MPRDIPLATIREDRVAIVCDRRRMLEDVMSSA